MVLRIPILHAAKLFLQASDTVPLLLDQCLQRPKLLQDFFQLPSLLQGQQEVSGQQLQLSSK